MKKIKLSALLLASIIMLSGCQWDIMGTRELGEESTFRYGYTEAWPQTRNPLLDAEGRGQILYYNQLYEPLADMGADYGWRGRLAEDWSLAADQLTWTFYLRKGVYWHDGEEFNADDVVATYHLVMNLGLPIGTQVTGIDQVTRIDDYTVAIKTTNPKGNLLDIMLLILPSHLYGGAGSMADLVAFDPHPVGTGPFRFAEEEEGSFVRYQANPSYWAGEPEMDVLLFTALAPDDAAAALVAGDVDYCPLEPDRLDQIPAAAGLWKHSYETDSLVILGYQYGESSMAAGAAILIDRQLRLALDQCLDFETIANASPVPVTSQRSILPAIAGDWSVDFFQDGGYRPYNPPGAAAILDKAGYIDRDGDGVRENKRDTPLSFTLLTTGDLVWAAEIAAANAAELGIRIEITVQALPWTDSSMYDMLLYRRQGGVPNPAVMLEGYTFHSEDNLTGYASDEYDTLVQRAAECPWPEERISLVRQAQQVLYRDVPCSVLFQESRWEICRSKGWQGWKTQFQEGGSLWCWETLLFLESTEQDIPRDA